MSDSKVGAGILNIITESLYDNPIVVFREYVQNSMDSLLKSGMSSDDCEIRIWNSRGNLYFLDNGRGIRTDNFEDIMVKIGASSKKKQKDLGYKGIGRLSGVPYCSKLIFVNLYDYENGKAQVYTIDSKLYNEIKDDEGYFELIFVDLMNKIGKYQEEINISDNAEIYSELEKYDSILGINNTGFMVCLQNISMVLSNTIEDSGFFQELQWLLPVNFNNELYTFDKKKELFEELTSVPTR